MYRTDFLVGTNQQQQKGKICTFILLHHAQANPYYDYHLLFVAYQSRINGG